MCTHGQARDREKSGAGEDDVVALKRLVIPEAKEQAGVIPCIALSVLCWSVLTLSLCI